MREQCVHYEWIDPETGMGTCRRCGRKKQYPLVPPEPPWPDVSLIDDDDENDIISWLYREQRLRYE